MKTALILKYLFTFTSQEEGGGGGGGGGGRGTGVLESNRDQRLSKLTLLDVNQT